MKDPAFLFYPNDYLGGTLGMTFEEKGAYIELLMMQFNRGHMTEHMIGQTLGQNSVKIWSTISSKFVKDKDGLYYNERLEVEQNKRKKYSESRRNNVLGINQHTKKSVDKPTKVGGHMTTHMIGHMEDENENRNIDIDNTLKNKKRGKTFVKPNISEIEAYCKERGNNVDAVRFFDSYESKGWIIGKTPMKDWKAAVRTWEKNNINNGNTGFKNKNNSGGGYESPANSDIFCGLKRD